MQEQKQKPKPRRKRESSDSQPVTNDTAEREARLKALDEVIDHIDEVLEEESFAVAYIQAGGE